MGIVRFAEGMVRVKWETNRIAVEKVVLFEEVGDVFTLVHP